MEKLNRKGQTEKEFLREYDASKFEKPSYTVDTVLFTIGDKNIENYRKLPEKKLKVLMVQRGDHPYIGQWAIPGGFVGINESVDTAAARELEEETGVKDIYLEQLCTWGEVERDPRTRVISTSYLALVDQETLTINAGDDADDAKLFSIELKEIANSQRIIHTGYEMTKRYELILEHEDIVLKSILEEKTLLTNKKSHKDITIIESDLAFDHAKILLYSLERLRNKVEYTDIAFCLMPELFTLTELQKVYEILLGKTLIPTQFRRSISNKVIETEEFTKDLGHRPAKLYRFNIFWEFKK